ncbi:TetR/AcrR family transcriptional regulator [Spongiactinospora rosea]|uniref:TetR/AcrR family transcriptional regulator n=1 Tax=Spongiactinospora rosea TaxID=2248750 RepID=A0A366LLC0_9ACTN|nr:TetR/AcrR family transcriptional regulator [Spongiactinospora rosea]RBQ14725.1 TetR/AcrR family transcriptional regulator [Spongiactinospora rosea]
MSRGREFDGERVLEAAMEAFWARGYASTSAQDLVDCTGLGRSSLYNAFAGKHQLYELALRRYLERNTESDIALLEEPGPVKERIRELMLGVVDAELGDPGRRGCLAVNAAIELAGKDEAVTATVRRIFARVEEALTVALERGQREGEVTRERSASALARFVLNAIYGLRVIGKTATDRRHLVEVVEATVAAL